jgi:dTDP-4-amino-4,6-dideoxygalactose transaminase
VLAGYLLAQFERKELIQDRRRQIWWTYHEALGELESGEKIRRPIIPPHCEQSYHMYYLLTPTLEVRTGLIHFLRERGILAIFHYQPLHLSHMGHHYGGRAGDCPVTESISDRLVRLPFYIELSDQEQAEVVAGIYDFFEKAG